MKWVERFPIIIYIGSGVLAWTSAKMITDEPLVKAFSRKIRVEVGTRHCHHCRRASNGENEEAEASEASHLITRPLPSPRYARLERNQFLSKHRRVLFLLYDAPSSLGEHCSLMYYNIYENNGTCFHWMERTKELIEVTLNLPRESEWNGQ